MPVGSAWWRAGVGTTFRTEGAQRLKIPFPAWVRSLAHTWQQSLELGPNVSLRREQTLELATIDDGATVLRSVSLPAVFGRFAR